MATKKNRNIGKKAMAMAGGAAAGEVLLGAIAAVATPFTGGATAPFAAAMLSASAKDIAIILGVGIAGATGGYAVSKAQDSKKITDADRAGYNRASREYEAKFYNQAKSFAQERAAWEETVNGLKLSKEEKDKLLAECMKYIEDLEKEAESLQKENRQLSKEKQELLNQLHAIEEDLKAA